MIKSLLIAALAVLPGVVNAEVFTSTKGDTISVNPANIRIHYNKTLTAPYSISVDGSSSTVMLYVPIKTCADNFGYYHEDGVRHNWERDNLSIISSAVGFVCDQYSIHLTTAAAKHKAGLKAMSMQELVRLTGKQPWPSGDPRPYPNTAYERCDPLFKKRNVAHLYTKAHANAVTSCFSRGLWR